MVAFGYFCLTIVLFAASNNRQNKSNFRREKQTSGSTKGRNRYNRSGKKKTSRDVVNHRKEGQPRISKFSQDFKVEIDPPPITKVNGPWPTYFTCRHTYEDALMEEILRESRKLSGNPEQESIIVTSPAPGLIRVDDIKDILPESYDPVYALQTIPNAVVVTSSSIKGLAKAIYSEILEQSNAQVLANQLRSAPKGCLGKWLSPFHNLYRNKFLS